MGNMKQHLGNTTSTTLHQPRDLWKNPRVAVLRIETLALVVIVTTFFLAVLGSCRRWSNHWIVQKGFLAANVLSLSLGTYSIGLMQSSSVKSEMYPIWTISLFTLFGCIDPVTSHSGLDYKGPLIRMLFQLGLYCGYVLLISISTISNNVGNTVICMLCAITFIKGFHKSLALVVQSRMQDMVGKTVDLVESCFLLCGRDNVRDRHYMVVDFPPDLLDLVVGTTDLTKSYTVNMADIDLICQENKELQSFSDVCVAFGLSHRLQRYIHRASDEVDKEIVLSEDILNYEWALKVIDVELAFLYEIFFTGNAFLHFYEAKSASVCALASFIGTCFVVLVVAFPRTMSSRHSTTGSGTTVVDTTTADLSITLVILVSLALLQLVQLIWCWTSNWARLAFICECARNRKNNGTRIQCSWWTRMRLKWFAITRTGWFDKYLWQDKLGQYSLVAPESSRREWRLLSDSVTSTGGPQMQHVLQYVGHVLWDLWGSDTSKGAAVRLDDEVKASITNFLRQVRSDMIQGHWLLELHNNGIDIDELPYMVFNNRSSVVNFMYGSVKHQACVSFGFTYAHCVMVWHIATCYCDLAEQEKEMQTMEEQRIGGEETAAAAAGGGRGEREKSRRVAITLSKYCTYLVASAPELLPGPPAHAKRIYNDFVEFVGMNLREANTHHDSYMAGVNLGKQLLGEMPPPDGVRRCSDPWKALEHLWVQMLVFAAPYGRVEAHMQHLAQGGEFISHLWALLYHLGIRKWQFPV